jgi:hypothetical protein
MLSEVFDEYPYESTGAKEAVDAGDVYRYRPILNFLRFCKGNLTNLRRELHCKGTSVHSLTPLFLTVRATLLT